MRILIGGFSHESNTFNPILTEREDFATLDGDALLEKLSGAAEVFRAAGAELIPCTFTSTSPTGTIREEAFRYFVDGILKALRGAGKLDGIFLHLHGAAYVDHIGSAEQFLLRKIRKEVGYDLPIAAAFDPHGNLSPDITRYLNIIRAYHTAPHVDIAETDAVAARALVRSIRDGLLLKPAFVRLPMVLSGDIACTRFEPTKSFIAACKALEEREEVETASFFISMASANTENTYPAVVITPSAPEHYGFAMEQARELAGQIYARRGEFRFEAPLRTPEEAVEEAVTAEKLPVMVSDSGDNTTAGATGMNTLMLRLFLERARRGGLNGRKVLITTLRDEKALEAFHALNPGDSLELALGSGIDENAAPVQVKATLKSKGKVGGHDEGRLVTVSTGDVDVTVTDISIAFTGDAQCEKGNFRVEDYDIVVLKEAYQFPDIVKRAGTQIIAGTPGATYQDIGAVPERYTKIPWTIWPFQDN